MWCQQESELMSSNKTSCRLRGTQMNDDKGTQNIVAIASKGAALANSLSILQDGIGDELCSETKFVIIGCSSAKPIPLDAIHDTETTSTSYSMIAMVVDSHQSQALFYVFAEFCQRHITMVKV